jgi:hypothetical protein
MLHGTTTSRAAPVVCIQALCPRWPFGEQKMLYSSGDD